MNTIFADGTTVDELVGLGILAGILTIKETKDNIQKFQSALTSTANLCGCGLGKYGTQAVKEAKIDPEIARLAARELANDCVRFYLNRTAGFLLEPLSGD